MIPKKNRLPLRRRITRRRNVNGYSSRRRTILSRFGRSRSTRRINYTGRRRTSFKRRRPFSGKGAVSKVLQQLYPINRFTYDTAQQEVVPPNSTLNGLQCKWFCPVRALEVNISYPNWTDVTDVASFIQKGVPIDSLSSLNLAPAGSNDVKFFSMNFNQQCKLVNQSNAQAVIQAYVCTARKDIPYYRLGGFFNGFNFLDFLGHGFALSNVHNQQSTGLPSLQPESNIVTGAINDNALQMSDATLTPFDSSTFVNMFSIRSLPKRVLNAGDITMFNLSSKARRTNKPSSYKLLQSGDSTYRYDGDVDDLASVAPKGAKFFLFKLTGQPAHQAEGEGVNPTLVKLTTPKIDMVTHVEFQYQYINPKGKTTYRSAAYGLNGGNQPTVIMNEAVAAPAPFVNA